MRRVKQKEVSRVLETLLAVAEQSFQELRGKTPKIGKFGMINIPKEVPPDYHSNSQKPGDKSECPQEYCTGRKIHIERVWLKKILRQLLSLLWKALYKDNFGTSKTVGDIENTKKVTLKNRSEFSIISPKGQGVWNTHSKTKQTQWAEASCDRHQETYGRRIRLSGQPQVRPFWQAQGQIIQTI